MVGSMLPCAKKTSVVGFYKKSYVLVGAAASLMAAFDVSLLPTIGSPKNIIPFFLQYSEEAKTAELQVLFYSSIVAD